MVKTFLDSMQLPVNPFDDVTIHVKANNQQFEIVAIGDITHLGDRKLMEISIKSIFTDKNYPWLAVSNPMPPGSYVQQINAIFEAKEPVRFIVTGDGIDINLLCTLEDFKPSYHFGETGECYYSLSLKEFRTFSSKHVKVVSGDLEKSQIQSTKSRTEQKQAPGSYTVKDGDSLNAIAKRYYGSEAEYEKILTANKNQLNNPNQLRAGQKLRLP